MNLSKILSGLNEINAALAAYRIIESFQKSFQDLSFEINMSFSVGYSLYQDHGSSSVELLQCRCGHAPLKTRGDNVYSL